MNKTGTAWGKLSNKRPGPYYFPGREPWKIVKTACVHQRNCNHSNQVLWFEDFSLFLFCLAQFYFDSFFLVSAPEAQALPVLQDQEHPQQERRQLLPEHQRQQDGAAVGRERQHRPPLQHRDGSAPQRQPPHSPRSSGHPQRASSHLAFTVAQPAAGRLSGSLFHGAHLQEAHVLRRLQPHDCR